MDLRFNQLKILWRANILGSVVSQKCLQSIFGIPVFGKRVVYYVCLFLQPASNRSHGRIFSEWEWVCGIAWGEGMATTIPSLFESSAPFLIFTLSHCTRWSLSHQTAELSMLYISTKCFDQDWACLGRKRILETSFLWGRAPWPCGIMQLNSLGRMLVQISARTLLFWTRRLKLDQSVQRRELTYVFSWLLCD